MGNGELVKVKKKSKKWKITGIVVGILVVLWIFGTISENSKYSDLIKQADLSMVNKNYPKAVILYNQAIEVKDGAEAQSKLIDAKALVESSDTFNKAMDSYKNHKYADAITKFRLVPKADEVNYSNALNMAKKSIALLIASDIKEASKSASAKNYSSAILSIQEAKGYDTNNVQLKGLEATYTKLAKAEQARLDKIAEAKVKAEAIAEAKRAKAEAKAEEARAKAEAKELAEKYSLRHTTKSDNYNVWKIYTLAGTRTFSITARGEEDNVICSVDGYNVVNEIGAGTYAMDVPLAEGEHTIEIKSSMGFSFSFN